MRSQVIASPKNRIAIGLLALVMALTLWAAAVRERSSRR